MNGVADIVLSPFGYGSDIYVSYLKFCVRKDIEKRKREREQKGAYEDLNTVMVDEFTYLAVKVGSNCHNKQIMLNHEAPVVKWLRENLKPDMTVFDIGANNGYYTTIMSKLVGSDGIVVACEADPRNYMLLEATAELNALDNHILVNAAIHSTDGTVQFGLADDCAWSGIASPKATKWMEVTAHTLDGLCKMWHDGPVKSINFLTRIDVIKIDVEGTESDVIEGAEWTLETFKPTLFIELHGQSKEAERHHPLLKRLPQMGYSVEYLIEPWFIIAKALV